MRIEEDIKIVEVLSELFSNENELNCGEIGALCVLITDPTKFDNLGDDADVIVSGLVDKDIIKIDATGNITSIDITNKSAKSDVETTLKKYGWNFVEINNVGYYTNIIDDMKYNMFKDNDLDRLHVINTATEKKLIFSNINDLISCFHD